MLSNWVIISQSIGHFWINQKRDSFHQNVEVGQESLSHISVLFSFSSGCSCVVPGVIVLLSIGWVLGLLKSIMHQGTWFMLPLFNCDFSVILEVIYRISVQARISYFPLLLISAWGHFNGFRDVQNKAGIGAPKQFLTKGHGGKLVGDSLRLLACGWVSSEWRPLSVPQGSQQDCCPEWVIFLLTTPSSDDLPFFALLSVVE